MGAREAFIDPKNIPGQVVQVPKWGVSYLVCSVGAPLRAKLIRWFGNAGNETELTAMFLEHGPEVLIDSVRDPETRGKVFLPTDEEALKYADPEVVHELFFVALKVSGLTAEGKKEIEGNSESTPSDCSTSPLPNAGGAPSPVS